MSKSEAGTRQATGRPWRDDLARLAELGWHADTLPGADSRAHYKDLVAELDALVAERDRLREALRVAAEDLVRASNMMADTREARASGAAAIQRRADAARAALDGRGA